MSLFLEAKELATIAHKGQFRKFSNEAYVEHPKRVAQTVLKYKESKQIEDLMIAAVLHDTIEDTYVKLEMIQERFGDLVASLVLELTSDEDITGSQKAEYLSVKMKNMSSWALVIKLADRLDNVSDLRHVNKSFRQKYIKETRYILSRLIEETDLSMTHLQLIHDILKEVNGVAKLDKI